ncbi:MAG TPA: hypothetical protein VF131_13990 [Blastocatellia bacterium]|nr:hypothetical protein [Blastocatellia bacterium]
MKLKDARENYYYFSQKTSEIVRQLGFAGIAVIWVFKTEIDGKLFVPPELISIGKFLIAGLGLDLFHYAYGTLAWGIYNGLKERDGTKEGTEFLAPRPINWPTLFFLWSKVIAISIAYIKILQYLEKYFSGG